MIQSGYINISYMQPGLVNIFHILQTSNMNLKLSHVNGDANK